MEAGRDPFLKKNRFTTSRDTNALRATEHIPIIILLPFLSWAHAFIPIFDEGLANPLSKMTRSESIQVGQEVWPKVSPNDREVLSLPSRP